jgi:murein DD-endopeptidase MepM/ murein hydrolase activator NlpD
VTPTAPRAYVQTVLLLLACTATPATDPPRGDRPRLDTADSAVESPWIFVERGTEVPDLGALEAPISLSHALNSGFGPRRLDNDDDRTDMHLGIDYDATVGTPVYAVAAGTAFRVKPSTSSSDASTLYIEHVVDPFLFQGMEMDRYYAVYSHLVDFLVEEDQPISAGQEVGFAGETGGANSPHLHIELRLGTHCSLRYSTENPDSGCARDYDPAINPLHAFPRGVDGPLSPVVVSEDPLIVKLRHAEQDFDFNRIESDLGVVDFDLRQGFDASTEEGLDDMDYGWVQLSPDRRNDEEDAQGYTLRFTEPVAWVELLDIQGEGWRLEL